MPDRQWYLTVVRNPDTLPIDFQELGDLSHDGDTWSVGYFAYKHEEPLELIDDGFQDEDYEVIAVCGYELEKNGAVDPNEVYNEELFEELPLDDIVVPA